LKTAKWYVWKRRQLRRFALSPTPLPTGEGLFEIGQLYNL